MITKQLNINTFPQLDLISFPQDYKCCQPMSLGVEITMYNVAEITSTSINPVLFAQNCNQWRTFLTTPNFLPNHFSGQELGELFDLHANLDKYIMVKDQERGSWSAMANVKTTFIRSQTIHLRLRQQRLYHWSCPQSTLLPTCYQTAFILQFYLNEFCPDKKL